VAEPGASPLAEPEAAEATRLGRELARLLDDVIEQALGALFAAVGERGLGFAELRVIRALAASSFPPGRRDRPTAHGSLARATGLSVGAVREALTALESRGMVTSPIEGAATLTAGGRALLDELWRTREEALTAFARNRDPGERLRLAGALQLLDVRFEARLRSGG